MRALLSITGLFISMSLFSQALNSENDVADLGPVLVPDPVDFSFETPGWYVLAALIFIVAVISFVKWLRNYHKNAYRRDAIKELIKINQADSETPDTNYLTEMLVLLKVVAMKTYGRNKVAGLTGKDWFVFLEDKGKDTPFSTYEETINNAVYQQTSLERETLDKINALTKRWIKTHA